MFLYAAASVGVLVVFFGVKATCPTYRRSGASSSLPPALAPFSEGVSVFGSVVLCLAGLIWTARAYHAPRRRRRFFGDDGPTSSRGEATWRTDLIVSNVTFVVGIATLAVAGSMTNSPGATNTAVVFAALW